MSTTPSPVCFGCGKEISSVWQDYQQLLREGWDSVEAMRQFPQLTRRCCRSRPPGAVDNIDEQNSYMPQQRTKVADIEPLPQPSTAYLRPEQIEAYHNISGVVNPERGTHGSSAPVPRQRIRKGKALALAVAAQSAPKKRKKTIR